MFKKFIQFICAPEYIRVQMHPHCELKTFSLLVIKLQHVSTDYVSEAVCYEILIFTLNDNNGNRKSQHKKVLQVLTSQ